MSKTFTISARILSVILSALMMIYAVPLEVFAQGEAFFVSGENNVESEQDGEVDGEEELLVLYEDEDLREADTKHYRILK